MLKVTSKIRVQDKFISTQLDILNKKSSALSNKTIKDELSKLLIVSIKNAGKARKIPFGKNGPEDLLDIGRLLSKTQAQRDRVSEIDIGFIGRLRSLYQMRSILEYHIKANYSKEISNLRTVGDKEDFVNMILFDLDDKIEAVDELKEVSAKVLQNLTNTYFTLKEIKDIALVFIPKHLVGGYDVKI